MPVGRDVRDDCDNDMKPRSIPGSERLETNRLGQTDDLETSGLGNFSTIELRTEAIELDAIVLSAEVPSGQRKAKGEAIQFARGT